MKVDTYAGFSGAHLELIAVSEAASRAIPPLWPLQSSVAVNPSAIRIAGTPPAKSSSR